MKRENFKKIMTIACAVTMTAFVVLFIVFLIKALQGDGLYIFLTFGFFMFIVAGSVAWTICFKIINKTIKEIKFDGDNCILTTYKETFVLPCANFTVVREQYLRNRILIVYQDASGVKKFYYTIMMFINDTALLDVNELKAHFVNAQFYKNRAV